MRHDKPSSFAGVLNVAVDAPVWRRIVVLMSLLLIKSRADHIKSSLDEMAGDIGAT